MKDGSAAKRGSTQSESGGEKDGVSDGHSAAHAGAAAARLDAAVRSHRLPGMRRAGVRWRHAVPGVAEDQAEGDDEEGFVMANEATDDRLRAMLSNARREDEWSALMDAIRFVQASPEMPLPMVRLEQSDGGRATSC
ncbi:hypothetical protein SSBR45G_46220 [Bradyrhizobium sp. SSBR45G]|uniref:hypothetical protein n=1 Tax=unclassified Bradyrhizobium TaxID=2631580 RepID=UPI0023429ED1|nr:MULTISPECIES: hypothetical protein [unclassified Bradyrhizobium]GLH79713.1 hypothetical protein SSBR45G_46220 [Bradyrhizobium sp. SSBR45G]GLH87169.1 hypothetical protein SSBR45R_46290 [Bradyrhizobium sp. SSBR45R]